MSYLYAPQGDYDAAQSRVTQEPQVFSGEKGNLYLKQIANFCEHINNNDIDYSYADEAVHVQEIIDKIYN